MECIHEQLRVDLDRSTKTLLESQERLIQEALTPCTKLAARAAADLAAARAEAEGLREAQLNTSVALQEGVRLLGEMIDLAQYHVDVIDSLASEKSISDAERVERRERFDKADRNLREAEHFHKMFAGAVAMPSPFAQLATAKAEQEAWEAGMERDALKDALRKIAERGCECICDEGCVNDYVGNLHEECLLAGHYICAPHAAEIALQHITAALEPVAQPRPADQPAGQSEGKG